MFGKLLQPEASFWLKMHKKHLATGLHPGPQGEHRALPTRPSWILGAAEGKGGQERDKTGRWEIVPPNFRIRHWRCVTKTVLWISHGVLVVIVVVGDYDSADFSGL